MFVETRKSMIKKCTISFHEEDGVVVATCLENDVSSYGDTIHEATDNIKEALELFFEDNVAQTEYTPVYVTTLDIAV
jgi:predicted RNase H-like HicB family nuclease